jgi:hypothetical protein
MTTYPSPKAKINSTVTMSMLIILLLVSMSVSAQQAIVTEDGYTWENVCDLNGYGGLTAALYTVTAIPNSFLLDKNGRIIAKNLRGKVLESKLAELMN